MITNESKAASRGDNMKKWLFVIPLAVFILWGCGDTFKGMESDLKISVTGTPGLKVSGHYAFVATGEVPKPQNVEGTVPVEYKGKGLTALCLFRKTSAEGTLKVEITRDGKVIAASETQAPMGLVSLTTPPPEAESLIGQILSKILGK
jgi:hypothetical protein